MMIVTNRTDQSTCLYLKILLHLLKGEVRGLVCYDEILIEEKRTNGQPGPTEKGRGKD